MKKARGTGGWRIEGIINYFSMERAEKRKTAPQNMENHDQRVNHRGPREKRKRGGRETTQGSMGMVGGETFRGAGGGTVVRGNVF